VRRAPSNSGSCRSRAYEFLRSRFRPPPPVSSMTVPRPTAWITGHSVRMGISVWKTCGGVVVYRASFAQETGYGHRLDIAAPGVAVEHVRARIGVSTGFRRVRFSALRLARAGPGRSPGGKPDRRKPNAGPTGSLQGDARSGGKSADGHDPSGSITSVDVHSCARSGTWATTRRVPGTAGWPDGRDIPRKVTIRGRPVWKAPLRKSAVFPVARTLRGARAALMSASVGSG
jgi:hypothetical protein